MFLQSFGNFSSKKGPKPLSLSFDFTTDLQIHLLVLGVFYAILKLYGFAFFGLQNL
jgi:hypothetical protein